MTTVWSYGGGTQTAAIAVLILQGKLPKPDIAVMADTGREIQSTWDYLYTVVQPALDSIGLTVEIAAHDLSTVDVYAHNGDILIPAFTSRTASGSKLPTYCSSEWKKYVIQRYLRGLGIEKCNVWLGISLDEIERMKPSGRQWYTHVYPLIEMIPTSRIGCAALIESFGWPSPPKSRCWMCPNQTPLQWADMRKTQPVDFEMAINFENEIRKSNPDLWLHKAMIPLTEAVDITDKQPSLFDGCDSGYCFV